MTEPVASRPYMPGYGVVAPTEGSGLLAWSWAEERLTASHDYWVASVWPDLRPHVMPVWGTWRDGCLWFSSGGTSRKARNLDANPRCTATTDMPREPVVVNGRAARVTAPVLLEAFITDLNRKYGTDYTVDFLDVSVNASFRLTPATVVGLDEADFTGSPTRWSFEAEQTPARD